MAVLSLKIGLSRLQIDQHDLKSRVMKYFSTKHGVKVWDPSNGTISRLQNVIYARTMFSKSFVRSFNINMRHAEERENLKRQQLPRHDGHTILMGKNTFQLRKYAEAHLNRQWGGFSRLVPFHWSFSYYSSYIIASISIHVSAPSWRLHSYSLENIWVCLYNALGRRSFCLLSMFLYLHISALENRFWQFQLLSEDGAIYQMQQCKT